MTATLTTKLERETSYAREEEAKRLLNPHTLTAGRVTVTVTLPETFVRARALLGDEWHPTYTYRIVRKDPESGNGLPMLFLETLTTNGKKPPRFVYTGVVNNFTGGVRLTRASAFPAHATRVRVADRVLRAIWKNRLGAVLDARWEVAVAVEEEVEGRF